jgi:hypothetical protein
MKAPFLTNKKENIAILPFNDIWDVIEDPRCDE